MPRSPREPRPVPVRRYRYTRLRWRLLVHALDGLGGLAMKGWRFFRPVPAVVEHRRILLVQLDHLGDSVLTSPILPRLKSAYPSAAIEVLASPSNRAVFEADPLVDAVHLADRNWFDRRPGHWSMLSAVWRLGKSLRARRYDLGIDVRGDVLTVLVLALAAIPRRAGWAMGGGGFLLTDLAKWVPGRHEVESRMALLDALGVPASPDRPRVSVHVSGLDRARVLQRLRHAWPDQPSHQRASRALARVGAAAHESIGSPSKESTVVVPLKRTATDPDEGDWLHAGRFGQPAPLLAVHLGAGTQAKRWPIRHWRSLIGRFLETGWRVVVIGGPDDVPLGQALVPHERLVDWTGKLRITETTALLERADLYLGADSGPAHLSACAGVPSVILFSGTNQPAQWRPWSRLSLVVRQEVGCRPCHRKVCPLADHPCMAGLPPDRVYAETCRWWARLHARDTWHAAS